MSESRRNGPSVGRLCPALGWLRRYSGRLFRADALAGLTLAAYLLPAAIGDASLARLPAQAGLYACLFSGLVFWLFCGSRHTAVTVTSAISLLLGTSLGELANGDTTRFGALAACTAILSGLLCLVAWLVRAGALSSFISETVLIGFKSGVALTLASTQLPKLLGVSSAHGGFWECARHLFGHLHEANTASMLIGAAALAVLLAGKFLLKNKPVALPVVVGGIVLSALLGLEGRGVHMLGEVPQGLPVPGVPPLAASDINQILPLAMACFLLMSVETAAIGRVFAARHGSRFDANQELLALAGANLAAGLGQGLPVSGGMSQSLVNENGGARTPFSGLIASLLILVVVLFFSDLLRTLPQPVLAAVVLTAVLGLVDVAALRHLWKTDRQELVIAAAALGGVLASGLLRGVLIGALISLGLLIHRAAHPHVAVLGRIPGTRRFSDLQRHPDNEAIEGVKIFRPEGALVYFNADHVLNTVLDQVFAAQPAPRSVVIDLSGSPLVDLAGAEMLKALHHRLAAAGVSLHLVEARSSVRDKLRLEGLHELTGSINRFTDIADAVNTSRNSQPPLGRTNSRAASRDLA